MAAVHKLLMLNMGPEVARAPVDAGLVALRIIHCVRDGAVIMAMADGGLVGSIGIECVSYWYSRETYLQERWMYVLPKYQKGGIWPAMIAEAKALAKEADKLLVYGAFNPNRRRGRPSPLLVYDPRKDP